MKFNGTNKPTQTRHELTAIMPIYKQIEACLEGEYKIKLGRTEYLPRPNSAELDPLDSEGNASRKASDDERYKDYLKRAVFYNVLGETNEGYQGQLQLKPPVMKLPQRLESLIDNADGQGLGLAQVIRDASQFVVPYGRGGWLTDFPMIKGDNPNIAEVEDGKYMPTVRFVKPQNIINWEERVIDNRKVVTMVVIREEMEHREEDSLEVKLYERYRVMLLEGENYDCAKVYLVWETPSTNSNRQDKEFGSTGNSDETGYEVEEIELMCAGNTRMSKLPFEFIGSDRNDASIDRPPLYTLSTLNIAHYRASADFEESVHLVGQPTPVATGLKTNWVRDVLKGVLRLGSRALIPLPEKGDCFLLQADPNLLAEKSMLAKENQMMAAGAELVKARSNVETKVAEVDAEGVSKTSRLSKIATNMDQSLMNVLRTAYSFLEEGEIPEGELLISINKIYRVGATTPEQLATLMQLYLAADPAITLKEIRSALTQANLTEMPFEEAEAILKTMKSERDERAKAMEPDPVAKPAPKSAKQPESK